MSNLQSKWLRRQVGTSSSHVGTRGGVYFVGNQAEKGVGCQFGQRLAAVLPTLGRFFGRSGSVHMAMATTGHLERGIEMMTTHSFVLVLEGVDVLSEELEDQLYEAGCDDALLLSRDGVVCLDFEREAAGLEDAVVSAIHNVEGVGRRVLRVEPDELVTASEIGERVGRSRQNIAQLVAGQRGPGGFPAPVSGSDRRTRLWRWTDVSGWLVLHELLGAEAHSAANVIAAVNGALQLRRYAPIGAEDLYRRVTTNG
jgi:hypothetical protein